MNNSLAVSKPLSPIRLFVLPIGLMLFFLLLSFTPRVQSNETLIYTFWIISALLLLMYFATLAVIFTKGLDTEIKIIIARPHYVQMTMHLCIFAYWGWYWPQVYSQAILILAQLVFVHIFDLFFRWFRGQPWIIGFGRFPIIFSTNLFLWFRDDWFYYQFIMITFGILAKECFTWIKDGRRTHIFNPSAISLAVASMILILTGDTEISWANEISNSLSYPPYIYIEIFILGLIVQYLFHVTLVTLATVTSLLFFGAVYYQITGVYFFYTSDIPIAVFLGLHLLVTDPSTSPKTNMGKFLFGLFYGLSVMALFELLEYFAAPTFYDKLLCIPLLNLSIIYLDRIGQVIHINKWIPSLQRIQTGTRQLNLMFMGLWLCIFMAWNMSGHMGTLHPGRQYNFWNMACGQDLRNACRNLFNLITVECEKNNPLACAKLGVLYRSGRGVDQDEHKAYELIKQSCAMGLSEACQRLHEYQSEDMPER